jgi:ribonuclease P protein component
LLKNGRKTGNEFFSVFLGANENTTRLFTANIAKKTFKKSVDRNKYKRWIHAVFHKYKNLFSGNDVLIMPRPGISKIRDFKGVEQALIPLFPEKKG